MSTRQRFMRCRPEDVFAVLSDGWSYGVWVVGSSRIRAVDAGWPAPGTRIHHSVGAWPLLIDDYTLSEHADPPRRLQLRARAWPAGEATVSFDVQPAEGGSVVTVHEQARSGPATLIPRLVQDRLIDRRNTESLRRLAYLAEARADTVA